MCATTAIFEVFILHLQISKWRKISKIGLLHECRVLQIQKIPKKVEAILEHGSGDFLVGFIAYRGHFWLVCLKYQRVHFRAAVGALEKKIIFYFKETFMSLFCCQSIVEASEKWNKCESNLKLAMNHRLPKLKIRGVRDSLCI